MKSMQIFRARQYYLVTPQCIADRHLDKERDLSYVYCLDV